MPSRRNISDLESLKEKLGQAKSVVLADYKGLTVAQITVLRNKLRLTGAEIKVSKNTLLKLAFKDREFAVHDEDKVLAGPTAIVFAFEDEVAPVKVMAEFARENSLPKFKIGFLGREFLSGERVRELAELPGKEVLLGKLAATLNAPLSGLMNVMQGNMRKLVYVLANLSSRPKRKVVN